MAARKLSDAYVELRADDSKLKPDVKVKAQRVGREFGGQLNRQLRALNLDPINLKANPGEAIFAIEQTRERLSQLSREAETVEVRVKVEDAIKNVDRMKKRIGDAVSDPDPDGQAASRFVKVFAARISSGLASAPPLAAAGGLVGALIAPTAGAAVAGGIVGGIGIGGVIGGLAIAAKDERVAKYAKDIAGRVEARFLQSASVFTAPAINAMNELDRAVRQVDIESIFSNASRFVPILTEGVGTAVKGLGVGVEAVTQRAEPAVQSLSDLIGSTGRQLGESLALLSTDAAAGGSAINDLSLSLNYFIETTVGTVHALAEVKGAFDSLDDGIDAGRRGIEDFFTSMSGGRAEFDITADGMGVAEARAKALADRNAELAGKQDQVTSSALAEGTAIRKAADDAEFGKQKSKELAEVQGALKTAQDAYKQSLDSLIPQGTRAAQVVEGLKTATQNLYGAQITASEANEAYEASWDNLTGSVKRNKGSLDVHTEAGRANRDSLQQLLAASNDMYFADIAAGVAIDEARKKHEKRTISIRDQTIKTTGNKKETDKLITTYGQIPDKKATDLVLQGVNAVIYEMKKLYFLQRTLAEGKTLEQVEKTGLSFKGLAYGGEVPGYSPHNRADNIPATVDGVPGVRLTAKEWVQPVESVDYYGRGVMRAIQHREIPREMLTGYARGGLIAPVDTSRSWPFPVNVSKTDVPTRAEAMAAVTPKASFGVWPPSPGAQRGDSGIWRKIVQIIRATGPLSGSFGNGYRPGDPLWHGSGRAVDWMGFNQDALASRLAAMRPLELIHRTNRRDYAYTRGRNKGSFNQALMNAHKNHIHAAFGEGGEVPIRQVAKADTGRAVLQQGWNLIQNNTGNPEAMSTTATDQLEVMQQMLAALVRLAPQLAEVVDRGIGGASARADYTIGARAGVYERI